MTVKLLFVLLTGSLIDNCFTLLALKIIRYDVNYKENVEIFVFFARVKFLFDLWLLIQKFQMFASLKM